VGVSLGSDDGVKHANGVWGGSAASTAYLSSGFDPLFDEFGVHGVVHDFVVLLNS